MRAFIRWDDQDPEASGWVVVSKLSPTSPDPLDANNQDDPFPALVEAARMFGVADIREIGEGGDDRDCDELFRQLEAAEACADCGETFPALYTVEHHENGTQRVCATCAAMYGEEAPNA